MFERLIDLVAQAWETLSPYVVINAWEQGVVLRFGVFNRVLMPGIHWKIPLADYVHQVHTVTTTLRLPPQALTTKDGHNVVVATIVKYSITNPVPYVTDIYDQVDVLGDSTMGAIRHAVVAVDWDALKASPPEQIVLDILRKKVNRYGFKIEAVTFVDLGRIRSLRLIGDSAPFNMEN